MRSVLLVEDEEQARAYIKKVLEKLDCGFVVAGEAASGAEALPLIRADAPDLVIADIVMPEMDGVELLKAVREEGIDCRFVMLTCMSDFEYARQAVEYGASGYLLKLSLDPAALRETLAKIERELLSRDRLRKLDRYRRAIPEKIGDEPTDHPEINKVIRHMAEHYAEELSLRDMAELACMEPTYLSDLFKKKTGSTLTHYVQKLRVEAAAFYLRETELTVSAVGEKVGFANDSYFIKIFKRWTGLTPSDYRRGDGCG
ncbi:response regulator [Paenibacillus flagellatus]|uniref:DNA-binding response regulator n=1 Tax=Paenibacillus flagellatus TaxID=2211139 RepID=A0A2V5K0N0_9BACL|nr:response regulator [Paenibacillus flagellatus]PYI52112.1 DNA-binding response regulator [Paenibacillus flagellatus]